jgi:hypothetical protein
MEPFETCPRCRGPWQNSLMATLRPASGKCDFWCVNCNIFYSVGNELLVMRDVFSNDKHLAWDFRYDFCYYGSYRDAVNNKALTLPWLPFDIAKEKLKLYLLFS